jgi:hypothetical protein
LGGILLSTATIAQELKIDDLVVAKSIPIAQRDATVKAAKTFCQFWNTGDETLLNAAIAPSFTDHTLLQAAPKGPSGPAFASKHFRSAVPDLSVKVRKIEQ